MKGKDHIKVDNKFLGHSVEWIHPFMDSKFALDLHAAFHRTIRHEAKILDVVEDIAKIRGDDPKESRRGALFHLLIDARVLDRDWIEENI